MKIRDMNIGMSVALKHESFRHVVLSFDHESMGRYTYMKGKEITFEVTDDTGKKIVARTPYLRRRTPNERAGTVTLWNVHSGSVVTRPTSQVAGPWAEVEERRQREMEESRRHNEEVAQRLREAAAEREEIARRFRAMGFDVPEEQHLKGRIVLTIPVAQEILTRLDPYT